MISAQDLVSHVSQGRDIHVFRSKGHRIIRIRHHRKDCDETYKLSLDDYDALMKEAVDALSKEQGKRFQIDIKRGYYGGVSAKVRSGVFGHCTSKLGLSPRHLAMLSTHG
jgi:hypothetical protein